MWEKMMPRDVPANNVPDSDIERVTRQARASGATKIVETRNKDGTWNVVVTFPN
jgi:hypothetical protein